MRTVLVTLIGPERTSDLVVDADTPVTELLPSLLASAGVAAAPEPDGWTVAVGGKQTVAPHETLEQAGVLDGAVLALRRRQESEAPSVSGPGRPGATPDGSPLARARALLDRAVDPEPGRRGRLRSSIPEAALTPDGRQQAIEAAVADVRLDRCMTIAVVSPKGGVGKTTLTVLLGELLCALRSDQVLALDGDSDYGTLGRLGPAPAAATARRGERGSDIFAALSEGAVTFAELDRTLWKLPDGLRIVPSPWDPAGMARADRSVYARVIGNLQRLASVLLIDCGTGLGQPGVQAAILASEQLVLVTDASGATASLTAEAFALLERAGRPITVVCNRVRRGRAGTEDLARLDALFPRASALIGVPDDPATARALEGNLPLADAPRNLRQATLELAAALALSWDPLQRSTTV